ncbi:putative ribonuclease H-like domain-containing protein [Tanacetum coccineum]|uniref:Ribonuclease H-like domain-containing protein n=1 Tax=Tanacetum coccineum TaxID=301880 RepID=A0ABQ5G545_9ASTR
MCDKKNSVLFTNTGCFVLSPDFKLADESQVLLKVPRKNNMYSVDMKNIIPKECLTCLVAKATLDESMIWHRRLEFKNRVMSEFCEQKGIKREFSVARTPQQNSIAERRNKTLIEAAGTMLVDSKLPTTFWAKVVNTACYVQNRVLVVKPYNKTPYNMFRGRTHALRFMRPFGCHVTILNTLDYLGKFNGKSDEGFFVGYSMNSKAFRVYNIKTRKVEENLHIRFLEDKPIIAGDGPKWLFDIVGLTKSINYVPVAAGTNSNDSVSTEESIGTGHFSKETGSSQDYILMPMWKDGSLFDSSLKNDSNDEPQPSSDVGKKDDEGVCKESGIADQEKSKNSTQGVNATGTSINTEPDMFYLGDNATLEATHADFFGDEIEVDISNITTTYPVPSTLNIRIHKDHSLDHVIGDVQSGEEPKKVIQALKDPRWIEAIQEELLQFKLQQVWTLMDLPHGKKAIGTKWVYRNKKDERVIVIRNKVRLVTQGYTQEEGIDYDEVFAPVARIKAIVGKIYLVLDPNKWLSAPGTNILRPTRSGQQQKVPLTMFQSQRFNSSKTSLSLANMQISLSREDNNEIMGYERWKDILDGSHLELDVRIGHSYGVKAAAAPTHSAFIGAASSGSKLNLLHDQFRVLSISFSDLWCSDTYGILSERVELTLKWQMAMLSLRINRFEKKAGRKMNYNNQQPARFDRRRYSAFKVTEVKTDEPKLLDLVDSLLPNWTLSCGQKTRWHKKEKKEWEVKYEATLARFEKWKESSKNLNKLINSSMSTRTKIGLGFKEYFGEDEVFDLSRPSTMYPEPVEEEVKPLYSWFVKAGEMHAVPPSITGTYMPIPYNVQVFRSEICIPVDSSLKTKTKDFPPAVDIKTLPESDVEDPNSTAGSPSFSCLENVKSPRIFCNKSGMNNRNVCKNNYVRVKKCFVCGSKLHLIKDCDFYNCVDSVPCKSKAASVPAGSRNSSASVTAGGSDPAASRNRPAVNSAGRPNPTGRVGQAAHLAAAQSNPAGWSKRPAPVSAGWLNPAARPYFRPSSVYFNNMYWPELYDPMYMNEGRWGTAVKTSAGYSWRIKDHIVLGVQSNVDCCHNLTGLILGTRSKLDEFSASRREGIVKFLEGEMEVFTNEHNCVAACNKEAHKASYKHISAGEMITEKLCNLLHMDLFGLYQYRSIDHEVQKIMTQIQKWMSKLIVVPSFPSNSFVGPSSKHWSCVMERNAVYARRALDSAVKNTTRFPVPSDVCKDQISSGIFTSSSYDDDFRATLTNLAPAVEVNPVPTKRVNTIHPQSQILGDLASPVLTRSRAHKSKFGESAFIGYIQDQQRTNHTDQLHCLSACFLSQLEPTSIAKALEDPDWVDAMQEEMQQFINQQVWKLVPLPDGKHAIGTKWILKNKRDARGIVVRNKARLVAQGHRQEEGIDYDEVFAPVARIEAIRLFLAFASYMGFLVYQLDVKSAFLYGEIEEEVYVTQPKGFEDPYFPKHVYRVVKALYGLHQAPRAWYARLSAFLLQHNYRRGTIDKTLFIKKDSRDILLVQVYVDDIIFGSTNKAWCDEFEVLMKGEFEMSAMGEMTFFLGLQVKQLPDGIFISQDKYVKDMLTKFDMESVRTATTPYEAAKTKLKDETDPPVNVHLYRSMIGSLMYLTASRPDIMFAVSACSRHQVTPLTSHLNAVKKIFKYLKGQPKLGLWYPKDSPFQLEAYSDSDYAGSHGDRKSTTGGCQFLGRRLISWQCKKQTIVATSSTEAEYVAAASCCAQVLWIQNQLLDYGFNFMNTKIFIDNQSTICIVKNPVFHQRTKHIEIRHHFIRDANEKNLIQVLKIHTNDNVADLLTKAFDGPRFEYLVVHIGMVVHTAARCTFFLLTGLVSAGRTMILLFDIAGWLVSATSHLVSAGSLHSCWCNNVSAA